MAKKDDFDFDDDDIGLDKDLDSFDGDDSLAINNKKGGKKNRNPVLSTLKDSSVGISDSIIGDPLKSTTDIMKKAIPKGLSSEADIITDIHSTIKDEVKTAMSDMKKAGYGTANSLDSLLKDGSKLKKLTGKIKTLLSDGDDTKTPDVDKSALQDKMIEEAISKTVGTIGASYNSAVKEQLALNRHKSNQELQAGIYTNIDKLRKFQFEITNSYYRRSLELQYRSLFAAKEQLEVVKTGFNTFKTQLDDIARNTGLPEVVKITSSETIKKGIHDRLGNAALDMIFNGNTVSDNVRKNIKNKIGGIKDSVVNTLMSANDAIGSTGVLGDMEEFGISKSNLAGSLIGDWLKGKAGEAIGNRVGNTKHGKKVIYKFKNGMLSPEEYLKELSSKQNNKTVFGGLKQKAFSFLGDLASEGKQNNSLHTFTKEDLNAPAIYDVRTKDSIVKIIPGLLAKIHAETQSIRMGVVHNPSLAPDNHELMFDNDTNMFKTKTQFKKDFKTNYKNKLATSVGSYIESFINKLKDNRLELSPKQTSELSSSIISYVLQTGNIAPDMLLRGDNNLLTFIKNPNIKKKIRGPIARMLVRGRQDYNYLDSIMFDLKSIKDNAPSVTNKIIDLHSSGLKDIASDLGLLNSDSSNGYSYVSKSATSKLAGKLVGKLNKGQIDKLNKEKKEFYEQAGMELEKNKITDPRLIKKMKTPKEILESGTSKISNGFNNIKNSASEVFNKFVNLRPSEIKAYSGSKINNIKNSEQYKTYVQPNIEKITTKVNDVIHSVQNSSTYQEAVNKLEETKIELEKQSEIVKHSDEYKKLLKIVNGSIRKAKAMGKLGKRSNLFKNKVTPMMSNLHKHMEGIKTKYRDTLAAHHDANTVKPGDDKLKVLNPAEEDILRSMYFESPEYINGSVRSFKEYARSYNVNIDDSDATIKTRFNYAKAMINKSKKRASDFLEAKYKEFKENINLKRIKGDVVDAERTMFFNSPEHQTGTAEDFKEWLSTKGLRTDPLLKLPSLRDILAKTRKLDKMIMKAGFKGLWGGMKLGAKAAGFGLKGGGKLAKYGAAGAAYGLDGLLSTIGLGFMGVNDGAPIRGIKKLLGLGNKPKSFLQKLFGKTRAADEAIAAEAPGATAKTAKFGAKGLYKAGKLTAAAIGRGGSFLGTVFGTKKHHMSDDIEKDKDGNRLGDFRERVDEFKGHHDVHERKPGEKKEGFNLGSILMSIAGAIGGLAGTALKMFKKVTELPGLLKLIGKGILDMPSMLGNFGKTAWNAVKAGTSAAVNLGSKLIKKITPEAVKAAFSKLKSGIVTKLGKGAGKEVLVKLAGKIAARAVPVLGTALLAYDAAMIGKDMVQNKTSFLSAVSKQLLGVDVFDSNSTANVDGVLVKPDELTKTAQGNTPENNGGFMSTIKSGVSAVKSFGSDVGSVVSNAAKSTVDSVKDFGSSVGNWFKGGEFKPSGVPANKQRIMEIIDAVSKKTGVDGTILKSMAMIESDMNPNAGAATSSAKGLFQFTGGTWKTMINNAGKKYGYDSSTSPFDPEANATMGAEYTKNNIIALQKAGIAVNPANVYMLHFLGAGAGIKFLKALASNPNASPIDILGAGPVNANKPIFFNGGAARTIGEVYNLLSGRLVSKAKSIGFQSSQIAPTVIPTKATGVSPMTSSANAGVASAAPVNNKIMAKPNTGKNITARKDKDAPTGDLIANMDRNSEIAKVSRSMTVSAPATYVPPVDTSSPSLSMPAGLNSSKANTDRKMSTDIGTNVDNIVNILNKQLDMQTRMVDALDIIAKISNTNKNLAVNNNNQQTDSTVTPTNNTSSPFPDAPIDLKRKTY